MVWWDILLSPYYKFIGKSVAERILKIDQHLAKLAATIYWHLFSGHGVEKGSTHKSVRTQSGTVFCNSLP